MNFQTWNGRSRDHLTFRSAKIGGWDLRGASSENIAIRDVFQGQCATFSEQNNFFS
jgi:hypothetical protein